MGRGIFNNVIFKSYYKVFFPYKFITVSLIPFYLIIKVDI